MKETMPNADCEVRANNDPFSPPLGCLNGGYSVKVLPKIIKEGLIHSHALCLKEPLKGDYYLFEFQT